MHLFLGLLGFIGLKNNKKKPTAFTNVYTYSKVRWWVRMSNNGFVEGEKVYLSLGSWDSTLIICCTSGVAWIWFQVVYCLVGCCGYWTRNLLTLSFNVYDWHYQGLKVIFHFITYLWVLILRMLSLLPQFRFILVGNAIRL